MWLNVVYHHATIHFSKVMFLTKPHTNLCCIMNVWSLGLSRVTCCNTVHLFMNGMKWVFILPCCPAWSVEHRKWLKTNFLYSDKQQENPFTALCYLPWNFYHKEKVENECSEYLLPLFLNFRIWMWFLHITVFLSVPIFHSVKFQYVT